MIPRMLKEQVRTDLQKGKVIIIYGPRQSGKTTLVTDVAKSSGIRYLIMNGDEPDDREQLSNVTSAQLKALIGTSKLLIIDEAQRIENIGLTLKLIHDQIKGVQVIATGSSAFDLADKISEPLTGRKYVFHLYPFSFLEMSQYTSQSEEKRLIEHRMVYGYYPDVVTHKGEEMRTLALLSDSYLYKDLFAWEKIKKPSLLQKLLKALSLQLGNEVSFNELSKLIGADKETVERYIDALEKAFVIFTLPGFSRNVRTELRKGKKIYFIDNGIRNALISNFSPPGLRTDTGALWENFLISERRKLLAIHNPFRKSYFWRTVQQQEVDYLEEWNGRLYAYEFKWKKEGKDKFPTTFTKAYKESVCEQISAKNFDRFVSGSDLRD